MVIDGERKTVQKYSRAIAIPSDVAERYKKYCQVTKKKLSDPLRVLVLESVPQLRKTENLYQIIENTKKRNAQENIYEKFHVRLPKDVITEINTYCNLFRLQGLRCHFLYYLIENKLQEALREVLSDK